MQPSDCPFDDPGESTDVTSRLLAHPGQIPRPLPTQSCLGSRGGALGPEDDSGVCPICGKRIPLGYAGLLPEHEAQPSRPLNAARAYHRDDHLFIRGSSEAWRPVREQRAFAPLRGPLVRLAARRTLDHAGAGRPAFSHPPRATSNPQASSSADPVSQPRPFDLASLAAEPAQLAAESADDSTDASAGLAPGLDSGPF